MTSTPGITMQTAGLLDAIKLRLVQPRPDCLLWPDPSSKGYGRIFIDGKERQVHRVVWELEHGPIPDGLTVDHLCRVRSCCKTAHMELVTQGENARRGITPAGSLLWRGEPSTHCRRGHAYTPENTIQRPDRGRRCRECTRLRSADKRRAARAA